MHELLLKNIKDVYRNIANAAMKAGRDPHDITLIAVTKTVEPDLIVKAVEIGLRVFGENRMQEAQKKITSNELKGISEKITWHMIGHLQKNKVKPAVELFDVIQSADSLELAGEINRHAEKAGKIQRVLIQVKLSDEESKHGISREKIIELLGAMKKMENLKVMGLMTIPPYFVDAQMARPYFRELRELRDKAEEVGFHLPELSMGMSNDFGVAIEEGATMVRVGTAIFGERSHR